MSIETNNAAGVFAVESKQTARVASRRIGFTLAAAMLAGTSLAPATAQVFDVNGISVTTSDFAALPGGLPIQILNNAVTTGTLRVNATGNLAFGGDLTNGTGVLALTKIGAGTLTLSGNNSFTGNTTVSVGTLQAGSLTALSAASRLIIAVGGTVDLNGFNNSVNGLNGTGTVTNLAGGAPAVLRLANSISSTFGGTITGNVGLLMDSGAGILQTLSQNNSFTGGVELRSGTLRLGADQALSGAAVSVTGNAVLSALAAGASITNSIDVAAGNSLGLTAASGGTLTLGGVISGDGGITKLISGTVRLNAANSFAGVTLLNGGRVEVGNAAAFSTGAVQVAGTTTLALANPAVSLALANNFNNTGVLNLGAANAGSTLTLSGNITTTADLGVDAGAGRVELTGANQFNNANVRVRSGTLAVDGADALTGAASVRLANAAALEVTTASTIGNTILALGGAGAVVGDIINDVDVTLSGRLHDASGLDTLGLRKLGAGTLTLSNASVSASTRNQLGGGLAVQAGTVDVTGRLFADVSVAAGGNLDVTGGVTGNVTVAGTGDVGAAGTLAGNVTVNDSGQFSNAGALTGNVTVNAQGGFGNTATGTTTGNVTVTAGGTAGGDGVITGNLSFANGVANSFRPFNGPGTLATLFVDGDLTLGSMTTSFFRFGAPGVSTAAPGASDFVVVGGQLTLGGTLDISDLGGFGAGVYRLFSFGTLNATTPLSLVGTAPAGFTYSFTTAGNDFFLNVDPLAGGTFYWDGADTVGVAGVEGGSGTWNTTTTNWTDVNGAANTNWVNSAALSEAIFTTTGGTVTLDTGIQFNRMVFEVDGYTIEGNGNALGTDAGSISVAGGATAVINADLGGTNGLTKLEAGTLRLSGNNGYTGGTNIAAGRVEISSNTALGVDTVTIADGTTLASTGSALSLANGSVVNGVSTIETGTNLELSGNVGGTGGITKTGAAQLILSGNNSFAGDVNLDAGTIVARNSGSLGNAATLNAADGTTLAAGLPLAGSTVSLGQSISIANRSTLTVDLQGDALSFFVDELTGIPVFDGTNLTLAGTVSGGALTITGGGAVRLQGNNNQSSTFVDRSVVFAESASAFGTGTIRVNEGAIFADGAGPLTLAQDIVVSGLFYVNGPQDITLSGTLSNLGSGATELGSLVKFGSGSLRLDGNNSINNVRLQDGRLIVGNNGALGTQVLSTANAAGTARTLQAGNADLVLQNEISLVGPLSVDTAGQTLTLAGQIFNTGSLVKTGAGNLILSGNNVYGGPTTVNAGTITAGSDTAFSTGVVTLASGTVLSNALGADTQRTLANNFVLGNVSIDSAGNLFQLNGVLNGAGTVAKTGAGTLRLTGNSANMATGFTGTIDVQAGILDLNGSIAGSVTVQDGGSLVGTGSAAGTVTLNDTSVLAPGNSPGTLTFGDLVLANGTSLNFELAGIAAVPGTDADLINVTSNLTLDGVLNITSLPGFNVGVGNRTLLTYGNLVANNGLTVSNAPPVDVTYTILAGPVASGAGIVQLNVAFNGIYRWDGANLVPNAAINGGSGIFNLTNTNFTNSDGSFNLAYGNNATDDIEFGGTAGTVDVASAINFDQMGFVTSGYVLGGAGSLNVNNSTINVNGNAATINTLIAGINGLTKTGAGDLTLTNDNSYAGGTALQAGSITVGSNTALAGGALTMSDGTGLNAGAAGLALANAVTMLGVGTVNTNGFTLTLNGVVDGAGSIVKSGSGNLILTGSNGYTGGTALTEGSLTITNNGSIGTGALTTSGGTTLFAGLNPGDASVIALANNVVLNGATTLNLQGTTGAISPVGVLSVDGTTLTLNGAVSGAGSLLVTGLGRVNLNGANSHDGGTTLTDAAAYVGTDAAFGTGTVTINGAVIGNDSGALRTLANDVVVNTSLTILGPNDLTLNGTVSGAGELVKRSTSTLTLNGANSYSDSTQLAGGTIVVGTSTALGTGTLFVESVGQATSLRAGAANLSMANAVFLQDSSNLAVDTQAFSFGLDGVISGTGALTKVGSGNLVLNGASSYSGGSSITAGTVTVGSNTALGTALVTMANGTVLANNSDNLTVGNAFNIGNVEVATGGNTFTLNGAVNGAGLLTKTGSGNLILSGDNGHTGGTALNAGTITVNTNTALGTARLTTADATSLVSGVSGLNVANLVTLNGGLTVDSSAGSFELSGVIDGVGGIGKVNSGNLTLSGVNSYTGGTNLTAGMLTITNDSSIGTGALTTADGTTLIVGTTTGVNTAITLANAVSLGVGTTTLALQGSFIVFNNDASIVTNGASLTLNGVLSGDGGLATETFGTVTLNGANSYAGGTLINTRSVVYVGSDTAVGTGTVTMGGATGLYNISGATRTLANSFVLNGGSWLGGSSDLVLNGGISGGGFVIKGGAQTLTLNAANSYTGNTQLRDGRITVGTSTAIGTGNLTVFAPVAAPAAGLATTLAAGPNGLALANNVTLSDGSNLIVESGAGSFTLNGVISSGGALTKVQSGTLILNGANNFTGGTALNAGTIRVGNGTALGANTLAMADATTLQAGVADLTVANSITTAGVGTIDTQGFTFTANGAISGAGSITKTGSGNLVLNGASDYSGGSSITAGTVTVGNNTALGTALVTMANGTVLANNANNLTVGNAVTIGNVEVATGANTFTLSGLVNGAGLLTKTGSGNLILSGNNGYTGGTALTEGTITFNSNTALGTGTVTTTGGTTLAAGVNDPSGGQALSLANAFALGTGATTIDLQGSTLTFGNDSSIVADGTALTLNGVVSGAGSLVVGDFGTLTLNGNNSYAGGTVLNTRSVVYVGSDTALGTGQVTMNGATFVYNIGGATRTLANSFLLNGGSWLGGTSNTVLTGAITGAGTLIKAGPSTLVLNGDNSGFTGASQLRDGRIMVGTSTALGVGGVLRVFAPGAAPLGASTTLTAGTNGLALANAITLDTGSNLVVESDVASFTLAGVISGEGALTKARSGNLILTGSNSYAGGTALAGGTLTVGSNAALGSGRLTMTGGTTLASGAAGLVLANAITTLGVGNVDTAGNIFTLNGVIDGAGSLSKINTGNLVLNGRNTFTGGSLINAGTVTVGTSTALGAGAVVMLDDTTLTPNTDGLILANAFDIGNVTVATEAFTFTLDGPVGGRGLLTKTGSGTLVLNGSNAYGGGTALTAGTIRVGNSLALGTGAVAAAAGTTLQTGASGLTLANAIAMAGGMTVDNFANQMTLGGVLSGTGPLSVIDSTGGRTGVLTLSGDNSYTGGTVVTGTTLSVSQNANLGNVAGNVTLVGGTLRTTASFATARNIELGAGGGTLSVATGTTLTSNGVISGTSLTKNSGELVLNAANTYTGGTALNAGTITVGNNAALGTGALAMADGTTLNVAPVTGTGVALANTVSLAGVGTINANPMLTLTLNGIVSGAGSVNKTGTGVLVLNGVNTYAGGTALNAGQITVGSNAALGTGTLTMAGGTTLLAGVTGLTTANNIVTLGAATINSGATPAAYTVSGVISGAGSVTKQGTGVLTVSGASTYTGATTVAAGTLNVTGSLVSAVTVNSAAALTGTGTVGALSVLAGGSVNPGAVGTTNIATLTVTGAATLAGTYTVNVSPSAADRITAGGALTLGGTLAVVPTVPAAFNQFNQLFTVATGASRTGTFAASTGLDQFGIAFNPVVEYTATAANIRLAPQSLVTLGNRFGGVTGNALEVAQAFDRAVAANTSVQTFFNVYANGGTDLPRTLRQMSGEQRATERRVVLDSSRTIREAALDRLNGVVSMAGQQVSTSDGDSSLTFWLRGAGSWGKAQRGEAATAFTTEQRGVLTGLDWNSNGLTLGGMFNYTSTNVEYQQLGGSSNVETVGGTLYAGYRKDGGLAVNAGASVAGSRANGARAITLTSFQQSLAGTTTGTTYQMFGELAWDLAASADTRIEPFARLSYVKADFGALAETGGVAALTAAKQGNDVTITNLGMRFGANVASGKVALNASASWQGTTGDRDARTVIGIASIGQNSNIRSVLIDRSALSLQADAGVNLSDTIRFSLGYSGLIGKRNDDHGGRATLNFAF